MSQYGVAKRCPDFDSQMVAVSNGRAGTKPNSCGPDGAWYSVLVPNLNFGGCCTTHDECYDSCPQYFEKCNNDFLGCMTNSCNNWYDHWYSFYLLPGCYAAADLYYAAVSGDKAAAHFQDGSGDLCNCQCADSNLVICSATGKTCQRVRGVGASDSQNCGGCGWDCGNNAMCSNAVCRCKPAPPTPNQCGNLCLDFKTHPRNCGACGNVCASGYCYQGACFTPPADIDICYPVNAITNCDFTNGLTGWSTLSAGHFLEVPSVDVGQTPLKKALSLTGLWQPIGTDLWNSERGVTVSTTLRLCSGVQYKLDFSMYTETSDASFSVNLGGKTIVDFQKILYTGTWLSKGPYTLPVFNTGDDGTSEDGLFLDVALHIFFWGETWPAWPLSKLTDFAVYSTGG